ncbi:hypothetical protein [Kordiimonas sp.]
MRKWTHGHDFHGASDHAEKRTRWVVWLTVIMMVAEIAAGVAYSGSPSSS